MTKVKEFGTYTYTFTGTGNCCGSTTKNFEVIPLGYTEKNGEIYFERKNIAAELDDLIALSIGNTTHSYSVLDCIKTCLMTEETSENMKVLSSALYLCHQAAKTCFGNEGGN